MSRNQRTLASYEEIARDYAESTRGTPSGVSASAMHRFADAVGTGGSVLELGSGPGWDADHIESLGARVRRTDATAAFRDFQVGRGKDIEPLDAILDDYGAEHYDGVMALCVLLHIPRDETDGVLSKVAAALRPGGAFLVSLREGSGEGWEHGDRYHVTLWEHGAFETRLRFAGLEPIWSAHSLEGDEAWLTVLAQAGAGR